MKKKTPAKDGVSLTVSVKEHGLAPILNAAYLLTDRAYARVDGDPKKSLTVTLSPKMERGGAGLKQAFEDALRTQKLRWAQAEANREVRERVARQGLLIAAGVAPAAPAPAPAPGGGEALTAEQQAEIDRLIAEVEVEIKELKTKPAGADPENVRATWEEKHEEAGS